jgi:hypothetical protein
MRLFGLDWKEKERGRVLQKLAGKGFKGLWVSRDSIIHEELIKKF